MANPLVGPTTVIAATQDLNDRLTALEQTSIVPVGLVVHCAGVVPNGWLACDGSAFDPARYGQLYQYLGGVATLPDIRGRVLVSQDAATFATLKSVGGAEGVTLTGAQSGVPAHTHPSGGSIAVSAPFSAGFSAGFTTGTDSVNHTHTDPYATVVQTGSGGDLGGAGTYNQVTNRVSAGHSTAHTHSGTVSGTVSGTATGTSTDPVTPVNTAANATAPVPILQPYIVLIAIIKF